MQIGSRIQVSAGLWVLLVGTAGFLTSAVFSSVLGFGRAVFVPAHALVTFAVAGVYLRTAGADAGLLARRHLARGILGGVVLGAVLSYGVTTQPDSPAPSGWPLLTALAWYGVVYGIADALLLNVVPVLAVWGRDRQVRRLPAAFGASLIVTALYHLGFAEFRGPALGQPLIGNAIATSGFLATGSPWAAILAHVAMHVAAVFHGMETTPQLPPHY